MVEDFDLYLSAVGMTCEGKLDAQFSSPIEGIGIVREENVDHIAADERLQTGKGLLPLAAGSTFALVIDADEIEGRSLESNLCVFLAQQFHTRFCVEISRFVFRPGVDFVIAVTAPDAERSAQMANLVDAIGDRITAPGDEVTSDHSEIGAEFIGHIHGAAHLLAGHVAAEVNVTDLDDLHAVESGRQVGQGNLDAADLIVQAFGSETVHSAEERSGAGGSRGGAEEIAAARVSNRLRGSGRGPGGTLWCDGFFGGCGLQPSPQALDSVDGSDCEIG